MPSNRPVMSVSVQFPDLSAAEFAQVRARLIAAAPGRVVIAHEAHRWYTAASDPQTVRALVSALGAAIEGRTLSLDDEEALDDLSREYADWLEESAETDDAATGPVLSFSVHLPALPRDEFAALAEWLRLDHPRRIVLGEQFGHCHYEVSERARIEARMPGIRAALRGEPVSAVHALALVALLNDYARWLSDPATVAGQDAPSARE